MAAWPLHKISSSPVHTTAPVACPGAGGNARQSPLVLGRLVVVVVAIVVVAIVVVAGIVALVTGAAADVDVQVVIVSGADDEELDVVEGEAASICVFWPQLEMTVPSVMTVAATRVACTNDHPVGFTPFEGSREGLSLRPWRALETRAGGGLCRGNSTSGDRQPVKMRSWRQCS